MSVRTKLNVHNFPRPPLLERTSRHLRITWSGTTVLDTKAGWWVLETTHPPTYYLPRSDLTSSVTLSQVPNKSSLCEWKGRATYWKLKNNDTGEEVKNKIWSYESPTPGFKDIKSYLCFYASGVPWECFVDDEKVQPQEGKSLQVATACLDAKAHSSGDFYGGWVTSELEGPMKGGPGTWGW